MSSGQEIIAENKEIWRSLFFESPYASLIADSHDSIYEANPAARKLLGLKNEVVQGQKVGSLMERMDRLSRSMIRVHRVCTTVEGREFFFIYLQDIREQEFSERLLLFFATTLKSLDLPTSVALSDGTMMAQATRFAVESLADWCRIDLLSESQLSLGALAHANPELEPFLFEIQNVKCDLRSEFFSPFMVIRSGIPLFKPHVTDDFLEALAISPEVLSLLRKVGLHSYICLPIRKGEEIIGSITFGRGEERIPFDAIDLILAEEFATKVGVNIERAQLYKSLAEMKDAAEAASRAKTNFLANVSHEIRTPLGAIVGFSELLLGSDQSDGDRSNWGAKIRKNSRHLLRIIDDILDLSKVEVGKLNMEINPLDFKKLLQDVYGFAKSRATEKGIQLEFVLSESLPRYISSDETRLSQILTNIIGNAIKFTSQGHVRLTIGWKTSKSSAEISSANPSELLSFEVSDTGLGLSESQAARLFQPFSQADTSYTRQFGGTGLGLALSRNLARGLGGDLVLSSARPGQGSTFLITIHPGRINRDLVFHELSLEEPFLIKEDDERAEGGTVLSLQGKKILLVEDSIDIQILFKRFLEGAGASIVLASNGEEGVRAAQSDLYDIVLMDVQMPIKDGCEATRELRSSGYGGLIVALTAHAMKEEYDRCMDAGYDAHLSKPIRRHDLIDHLTKFSREHIAPSSQVFPDM